MMDKIIKEGQKYGDIVALSNNVNSLNLEFSNRTMSSTTEGNTSQLSIRISNGKKFGHSTTSDLSKWKECLQNAVKIMNVSKPLDQSIDLAIPTKIPKIKGIFSSRVKNLKIDKLIEDSYKMHNVIDKQLGSPNASISKVYDQTNLANSNGINISEKETLFSAIVETNHKEVNAREIKSSHDLFNLNKIAKASSELCLKSLKPKSVKTFKGSLIMDYFAIAGIIETVLVPAVCADSIQTKRSFLSDKLNQQVFSDKITIIDDGRLERGLMSCTFDVEGTPKQRNVVINKGVFEKPLYDIYSAKTDKTESTGNCGSINKIPFIVSSNFMISPGDYTQEEMIKETKEGIFAKNAFGLHLINKVTGDCSIGVENAFYIKNGKIKHPITQAMVSFNLFDELKKLEVIGKETRQEFSVVSPNVRFDNIQIIG